MAKYIKLPDNSLFPVAEGEDYSAAMRAAYAKYPEAFGGAPTQGAGPESGFTPAFKAGVSGLKSGIAALAGKTGIMDEAAAEQYMQEQKAYQAKTFKPTATFGEAPVTKTLELLGGSLPYMVAPVVAGGVAASAPVAGALGLGTAGATALGLGATGLASGAQFTGSNIQRQMETDKTLAETDLGAAALAAVPQAALDVIGLKMIPGLRGILAAGGKEVSESAAKRIAEQGLKEVAKDYAAATGKAMGAEGLTEAAQQVLERAQAGLKLTDPEARAEYFDSLIGGAVLGGALAPVGRRLERGAEQGRQEQAAAEETRKSAAKAAAEAEAAKTTPEALRQLETDYRAATQQKAALDEQIKAATPKKGATAEEKAAFQQLKDARTALIEQLRPLSQEYNKRKGAIATLEDTRQAELEAQTAEQPTAAAPVPSAEPKRDVQRLMLEQDDLRKQMQELETQLEQAPPEQFDALNAQRQELQRRLDARATFIEEAGGSPLAQAEFEQATAAKMQGIDSRMAKLSSAYTTALGAKDYDAAAKAKDDLLALRQEREALTAKTAKQMQVLQEKQTGMEQRGQTRELFDELPEQPAQEGLKFTAPTAGEAPVEETIKPKQVEALVSSQQKIAAAQEELDNAVKNKTAKTPEALYPLLDKLNQAQNEASRAVEDVGRPTLKPAILDIFSPANLFNTAYADGDTNLINALARQTDKDALRIALDANATEREKLTKALDTRLDLGGEQRADTEEGAGKGEPLKSVKRERADLFSKQYDPKQQALFKNGTYPDRELQALYDKGGTAAVEYENVMRTVEALSNKVTTKQGNARKSLYEKLVTFAAEHAELVSQMEAGIAVPTKRERVAALQAKLGKGEAPAPRQMDASERYQLQRRIDELVNKYRMAEGKVAPIRDQIIKAYESLYTTTPLEKASTVAERKKVEAEKEAQAPKGISRTARTATRIAKGDVRKEAETSQKMRDLARDLGEAEDEYKQFSEGMLKRYANLKGKYGANDPAVIAFQQDMAKQLIAKAEAIGKQTPEYKATLKEQIAYFQEVLPTAGKQTVPTKRSTQVTRKQTSAPSRLVTSSPESRKQTEAEGVREKRRMFRDFQEGVESETERMARGVEVESPDLTPTQVQALVENDLEAALQDIANDSENTTLNRAVARRLAVLLDITDVKLVSGLKDKDGTDVLGMATSRLISLDKENGVSQEVLLHEGVHAGTERVIQMYEKDPSQLTEIQRIAVRELKALHAAAKADPRITSANAKSSLSEFVAEVMSNKNLQEQLRKKAWKLSDAWAGFKSIIMRMLGASEDTKTMLGAAITAVDALFVPPTLRYGKSEAAEVAVPHVLAQKDIAALDNGSNSMREFAAQFGMEIKQKDRTPEDADRIGKERLKDMQANPADYVAPAEPDKLDYRVIMSDGKPFDADNLRHYVEADAGTFANIKAQENALLRKREAARITEQREDDLTQLVASLLAHPEYTFVEQALVAKAASKFAVTSDKNGRLKLVTIDTNNRHQVAVVGAKGAASIIEELRAGKPLKEAFLVGLQRNADMYAKDNQRKQGWQKFEQSDKEDDAVALNAGAAGTAWCTGGNVSTARAQISEGDFYIHYTNGKPDVAVRMDGSDQIGEIRGNTPTQALTQEQQRLTETFLRTNRFERADDYLEQLRSRHLLEEILAGNIEPKKLMQLQGVVQSGQINKSGMLELFNQHLLDGYGGRPELSTAAAEEAKKLLTKEIKRAYEAKYFVGAVVSLDQSSRFSKPKLMSMSAEFDGVTYKVLPAELKGAAELDIYRVSKSNEEQIFPALEILSQINLVSGGVTASLPKVTSLQKVLVFLSTKEVSTLHLSPNAAVSLVAPARSGDPTGTLVLTGAVQVDRVRTTGNGTMDVILPDALYVARDELVNVAKESEWALQSAAEQQLRDAGIDNAYAVMSSQERSKAALKVLNPFMKKLETLLNAEQLKASEEIMEEMLDYHDSETLSLNTQIKALVQALYDTDTDATRITDAATRAKETKRLLEINARVNKSGLLGDERLPDKEGKITAPKKVADTPPQALVEAPEVPVYARRDYGVKAEGGGVFSFVSRRTPGEFDATPEPSKVDTLLGNLLGLAGRMQLVDKYAAVSEAFKQGMSKGVLTDVEAGNAEYLIRFGEHRSQLAGQALTNGPLSLVTTKTDRGIEHTYQSTKGANAVQMAEALNKGGFANDSEAEGMLTLYVAGARAEQVGWEKLNYTNPGAEKDKYQRLMDVLKNDKQKEDAIKEAAKIYQQFNNGQMDFIVQTGVITAAKAAELKAITYVPFYRVNNNGEVQLMIDKERPLRIGNIKDEPQLQQLVGDNKQIMPIFASMVQNTFMLTNLGLRNQSVKETSFMLRKIGIASRIGKGPGPAGADTVRFKKNGEDMHVVIDTDMYGIPAKYIVEGMEGIKTTIPAVVKLLGVPADILRQFVTRSPTYAIRQMIRDPLNAWLTTGTDAAPVLSSFKELASMVAGRSETERKLMESGAVSSNVFTGDERDMDRVLREITSGKAGWTKLMAKADAFALQGDTATRAVIYKDSIAKGMSHQQALLRAVEAMNFSRRGLSPSIQMLSTMIPFFNAQIQGLDVLHRAFTGKMPYNEQLKIREKLFKRGLLLAAGTAAYALAMQDDEAYKRAKPEERYGNWFVYIPGVSEPVRVPIPFELGYVFKSLPEALVTVAFGDEKASSALSGIGKLLAQSNPFALPQAVKPLTEAILGKSFFSGDIESEREKNVLATARYRDSSTEVAKLIGSVTGEVGLSPIKIDYLIRGYTGGLGIALVQLANPLLNTETSADVAKPSMKPSKMPFIGGLFQPVEGRGTLDSAYDKMLEIQQIKGTYNDMAVKGKRAEAMAFAQEYSNQLAMASTSGSVQQALGKMAAQERAIKASPNLTTEQKDEALARLDKLKVAYARQFLTLTERTRPQ